VIFRLDKPEIKRIGWVLSEYMPDGYNATIVGEDGVTKINAEIQHLGDSQICWLQIWKGSILVARFNAVNIDSIIYEEEK